MSSISWGKPVIKYLDLDESGATWQTLPTPVEDSTELTTNQGDKLEAKIEGGENEDSKNKKSTYDLKFDVRMAKNRTQPIESTDGVVEHHYAFALQPEDATAPGFLIDKSSVVCDSNYTAADGAKWQYVASTLTPDSGEQVKWGVITFGNDGTPTCTPIS